MRQNWTCANKMRSQFFDKYLREKNVRIIFGKILWSGAYVTDSRALWSRNTFLSV
jgi:hypothetical protein